MAYRVQFSPSAARQFRKLDPPIRNRITPAIDALVTDPRPPGVEKLAGTDDAYRIRVGDWRVVYAINDEAKQVVITRIGHRGDVYR